MKIKLVMDEKTASILSRACEMIARCGMGQFKDLFEMLSPEMHWDDLVALENRLKEKLIPNLSPFSYNSILSSKVSVESKIAWSAYQHLRRELAYMRDGKDWRVDKREFTMMMTVDYDEPFNAQEFTTEIEKQ